MATWITDRTQEDVDRVNIVKAQIISAYAGTEIIDPALMTEWNAGMKGALSYTDFNRIESGMAEIAEELDVTLDLKTEWTASQCFTVSDGQRWINNINALRAECDGYSDTPETPKSMNWLTFQIMNRIEKILSDIESKANSADASFAGEIMTGEDYYGFY